MPKFMLIMRQTDAALEAQRTADIEAVINAMGAYNESLVAAGVLLDGDGLAPEPGHVVSFDGPEPLVTDGPYGETHELFNGFWTLGVASAEEAIEWARRAPLGAGQSLEVRRITDESDFAEFADNAFLRQEEEWRRMSGENR
jgi:hypothetical protein